MNPRFGPVFHVPLIELAIDKAGGSLEDAVDDCAFRIKESYRFALRVAYEEGLAEGWRQGIVASLESPSRSKPSDNRRVSQT